jgi:hypothetical protein
LLKDLEILRVFFGRCGKTFINTKILPSTKSPAVNDPSQIHPRAPYKNIMK